MKKIIIATSLVVILAFSVNSFANVDQNLHIDEKSMEERMNERTEIGEIIFKNKEVQITYKGIIKSNIFDGFDVLVDVENLMDYEQTVQIRNINVNEKASSGIFSVDVPKFSKITEKIYINAVNRDEELITEIIDLSLEFIGFNQELMVDTFRSTQITIKN